MGGRAFAPADWRKRAVVAALAASCLFGAAAVHAQVQGAPVSVDIPAQPLSEALKQLGRQTPLQLFFAPELVSGKNAPAVRGQMAPGQALDALLKGSGLEYVPSGAGVTLRRASGSSEQALPEVKVSAAAARDPTTEGTGSYTTRAVTIGKTPQTLREIPQSVSVLTRQRIEDQNLTQIEQALDQMTGLQLDTTTGASGSANVISRGFLINNYQYDGVPQTFLGTSFTGADLAVVDRVEVIRGAAGLLQGAGNPSAAVNLVRKKPTHDFAASIGASVGSWNFKRTEGDVSGPLNADGSLRGRLVGVYEDREYFVDYMNSKKKILYGVLDYDFSPATTLSVGFQRQEVDAVPSIFGLPRYSNGASIDLPRSTNLMPAWNRWSQDITEVFANLSHRMDNDWKLNVSFLTSPQVQDFKRSVTRGNGANFGVNPFNPTASIYTGVRWHSDADRNNLDANAAGKVTLLGRRHDLMFGLNSQDYVSHTRQSAFLPAVFIPNVFTFNPATVPEPGEGPFISGTVQRTAQRGLYGSARLNITDPLKIVLGARLTWYRSRTDNFNLLTGVTTNGQQVAHHHVFTPYAGLIYDLNQTYSLYASYADIFSPQTTQFKPDGSPLDPIVGANYEAGIKGEFLDKALNASLAVFRIEQENRAQEDLANPCATARITGACYQAQGKVRSEGFEAEVSGKLTRNWDVFAGYTYTETRYVQDRVNQGIPFRTQTPRHMFKLWTQYRLPFDAGRWSVGGGLNAQSSYYALSGTARADQAAYAVLGLRVAYRYSSKFSVALNLNNVLDKKYYSGIRGVDFGNVYGEPRNFMLSARMSF